MADPTPMRCDGCGQTDTDPKLHYGAAETYHHDCVPARVLDDLVSVSHYSDRGELLSRDRLEEADMHPHVRRTLRVIEAAKSGKRGAELRKHIVKLAEKDED
jgi:hypothetical protein